MTKVFILEIDDDDIGVASLYHIFDNSWLYKKINIREQNNNQTAQADDLVCCVCGDKVNKKNEIVCKVCRQ